MKHIITKIRLKIFNYKRRFQTILGIRNLIYAKFWNISIGKNSKFRGHCYFRTHPNSRIKIGNSFECVSITKESNLIKCPCKIQTLEKDAKIIIGNNVGMSGCIISCFNKITIGDDVKIGGNTTIMDGDFHKEDPRSGMPKEIIIDNNVWIGYSCIILKGVHIGKNSIIGAGSIVTKDIPENSLAAGNPCKVIKSI
jgi:acetyltransferase-like isoleucine patch superfamily enzyme